MFWLIFFLNLTIIGDYYLFDTTNVANVISVTLLRPLTDTDIEGRSFLTTNLIANKPNVGSDTTVLLVNIDIPVTTPSPVPQFEKPMFRGSLSESKQLSMEVIALTTNTFTQSITFTHEGGKQQIA